MSLTVFESKNMASPRVAHGFFSREGGVSTGIYAGLNCGLGSRDERDAVEENRRRVAAHFGGRAEQLCSLYQVHSPTVINVHEPTNATHRADAMVTTTPGLILSILTADCAPVLFADVVAGVIGAAHAGWKGAVGGVIENTVQAMLRMGARRERIVASIGPCIGQQSYEVGPEFIEQVTRGDPTNRQFFKPNTRRGHAQFNLGGYVLKQCRSAGLQDVTSVAMDTCADETLFFSYRRTVQRKELDYGRQISCITLRDRRSPGSAQYTGPERRASK